MMVAAVMMTGFPDDAMAASRTGGRVGGSNFRSAARSAPRTQAYSRGGSRTTINRGPTVIFGGPTFSPFGFGYGGGFGMYGFGPYGYGYNPALSLGLTFADVLIQEQRR